MVHYRRQRMAGGSYFFTVTLQNRRATTLVDRVDALRAAFLSVRRRMPFVIDAIVVLPDHIHAIWTLPPEDSDYPRRWQAIKSRFTRTVIEAGAGCSRDARGEYDLWQRRYWEHTIRDDADLAAHVEYIHHNPVKHGYVTKAADWPHSTFHRYVARGLYPADWACTEGDLDGVGHE